MPPISTVRLLASSNVKVDLLFASSGIEPEIVARAGPLGDLFASLPVARAEELVAMKVLSMSPRRLQDRLDVRSLLALGVNLDEVRANLRLIAERGFSRGEDLLAKLEEELAAA